MRKTKIKVVRRGLELRQEKRDAYRKASLATRAALSEELPELDHLASEGLAEL